MFFSNQNRAISKIKLKIQMLSLSNHDLCDAEKVKKIVIS